MLAFTEYLTTAHFTHRSMLQLPLLVEVMVGSGVQN